MFKAVPRFHGTLCFFHAPTLNSTAGNPSISPCSRYRGKKSIVWRCVSRLENTGRDDLKKRISDMATFLREQPTAIIEYDEQLVRRLIEKVTIYDDKFTVEFKSGVSVDVNE